MAVKPRTRADVLEGVGGAVKMFSIPFSPLSFILERSDFRSFCLRQSLLEQSVLGFYVEVI